MMVKISSNIFRIIFENTTSPCTQDKCLITGEVSPDGVKSLIAYFESRVAVLESKLASLWRLVG